MSDLSRVWFIPNEGRPPEGPFTVEEILLALREGRLSAERTCWREGMAQALPLRQLAPFAARLSPASSAPPSPPPPPAFTSRRVSLRAVAILVGIVGLLAAFTAIFEYRREVTTIRQAGKLITAGKHAEAGRTLRVFLREARIFPLHNRAEVEYLLAWVSIREYADASAEQKPNDDFLESAKERLETLFARDSVWRRRANSDLGSIIGSVPLTVADVFARSAKLAELLEGLGLADDVEDARALLAKAEAFVAREGLAAGEKLDASLVQEILSRDPSLGENVVDLALPKRAPPGPGIATIVRWVTQLPAMSMILGKAVVHAADQFASKANYDDAGALLMAVKPAAPQIDILAFWQCQFDRVADKDPAESVRILTSMVRNTHDPALLERAIKLYAALKAKHEGKTPQPPPAISSAIEQVGFEQVIADAQQRLKSGQFSEAAESLEQARKQSPNLWAKFPAAQNLVPAARFGIALGNVRKAIQSGDTVTAEQALLRVAPLRPAGDEGTRLWDLVQYELAGKYTELGTTAFQSQDYAQAVKQFQKAAQILPNDVTVQTASNRAVAEKHRVAAEEAIAARDFDLANNEILAARETLESYSQTSWGTALSAAVNALAKTSVTTLRQTAVKLSDRRQYAEGRKRLHLALRLLPKDPELLEMLQSLELRAADPKTAGLSGIWVTPKGAKFELKDDGSEVIHFEATALPEGMASCSGEWRRKGEKLDGRVTATFTTDPKRKTEGVVPGTIKDARTLSVFWNDIMWLEKTATATWTWRGKGEGPWKKEP